MDKIPIQMVNIMMDQSRATQRESRYSVTDTEVMAKFALHQLDPQSSTEASEKAIVKILLAIEDKFRAYFDAYEKEMELQRIAAQTLWHLVQRYMIAVQVDTSCTCPKVYEIETEEAIINKYHMHYQVIVGSNKSQRWGIHALRPYVLAFRRECAKLDLTEETPFILGDAFHKPITFFMELVDELFNYFYSGHQQVNCAARLLDPADLKSLEYYQELLAPNEDFNEYFLHNLSFCKCLKMPPRCAPIVRESHTNEVKEGYVAKARKARCLRRIEKMSELKPKVETPATKRRFSLYNVPSSQKNSLSNKESNISLFQRGTSLQHQRSLKFLLGNAISVQHIYNPGR